MKNALLFLFFSFTIFGFTKTAFCQSDSIGENFNSPKGKFYLYWGYNRTWYRNSTFHVKGPEYDLTFYNLKATDRPTPFSVDYINPVTMWVPQYNYRLGYFITDRISASFGVDHMKYVVTKYQTTTMSGVITEAASVKYAGSYLNDTVELTPDLLLLEHTNGFNLMSAEFEYLLPITRMFNDKVALKWNFGLGGIWMITKTDVKVLNYGLDNDFHLSGYTIALKTGPRIDFWDRFFVAAEIKNGFASLPNILIHNDQSDIGDQNITYYEFYVVGGYYFSLFGKRE